MLISIFISFLSFSIFEVGYLAFLSSSFMICRAPLKTPRASADVGSLDNLYYYYYYYYNYCY